MECFHVYMYVYMYGANPLTFPCRVIDEHWKEIEIEANKKLFLAFYCLPILYLAFSSVRLG